MTDRHSCPLCTETYDDRTDLHIHLEVNHRKSEIVTHLVERRDSPDDSEPTTAEEDRPTPSAD